MHKIELWKRTEALFGVVYFAGLILNDGASLIPPPSPLTRKLEFIGASVTCGYGIEGIPPCRFTSSTENSFLTYGAVVRSFSSNCNTSFHFFKKRYQDLSIPLIYLNVGLAKELSS